MLYRHIEHPALWRAAAAWLMAGTIRVTHRLRAWLQTDDAIRSLQRLDDHLLADLGLERSEIAARVKGRR